MNRRMNSLSAVISQFEEPIEHKDKWGFEITIDGASEIYGPYESEDEARLHCEAAMKILREEFDKGLSVPVNQTFLC